MIDLPEGWRMVSFGDVVRQVHDRVEPEGSGLERYVAGEHMQTNDLRIRSWGTIGDGYLGPAFHMRFKPGHVLYGSRRTYLRKVAVADFEGVCANTTFVLEASTPDLLPDFLPLVMTTEAFHAHSIEQSKGSVNPYINFRDLKWYRFVLPPIEEQRTIAEATKTIAVNHDSLVASNEQIGALERSLRHELFTVAMAAPSRPLAEVSSLGPQNGVSVPKTLRSGNIALIGMGHLFAEEIVLGDLPGEKVSLPKDTLAKFSLEAGDLLFARRSIVLEGAGRCVMVGELSEPTVFESSVIRVRVDASVLLPGFVLQYLHSPRGSDSIRRIVRQGAVSGIAGSDLRAIPLPLPPLSMQQKLLDPFSAVIGLRRQLRRQMSTLGAAGSAMREAMMSGVTRVQ